LVKMGDMFNNLHDVENAKANYKLAADRSPDDIRVWSKYIDSLIQSYEWADATKAMDRFRKLPVSQSAIDKAAADMNQKQDRPIEAQLYYKKAMARDVIDSAVYAAYGKSLMSTKNFKDAPFFFSLALRFDPLNVAIKINIAKCVAETESIDRAISMLQDEINQNKESRAEYLAAIAEFQIQKGAWEEAKYNIGQALQSNPDYAYTWKLQAQVHMNREGFDNTALDSALAAYKSYSERNPSDPSGYLERYKIFARKAHFDKAKEELDRIYSIYPKYPNLHYYLGALYALQGNHKVAAEEFRKELENNPNNFQALIAYGKELLDLGRIQDALIQFTKAMQLNPRSSEAKQQAGWANLGLKNYQAAISLVKSAIDIDKANPLLYKRLGLVYRDMNDLNSACIAFRKYLEMEPDAMDKSDFASCF
ncbi:MAG: tetratricopeptide repeat protein, partial [Bdellovibrionia bacterium]